MRISSAFIALLTTAAVVAPQAAEASYREYWRHSSERPSHRSIENGARDYRSTLATHRRVYQRQLLRIEKARDEHRQENYRSEAPAYNVDKQGFVPFHTLRFRRSVRHFHWNSLFQETPEADVGQGPGDQAESAEQSGR